MYEFSHIESLAVISQFGLITLIMDVFWLFKLKLSVKAQVFNVE